MYTCAHMHVPEYCDRVVIFCFDCTFWKLTTARMKTKRGQGIWQGGRATPVIFGAYLTIVLCDYTAYPRVRIITITTFAAHD